MAQSLTTIRSRASDSIKGRKLGFDLIDETLNGVKDIKRVVQDLTSASTGTVLNNYGIVNISGTSLLTSAQSFAFSNPMVGAEVTINNVRANSTGGTTGSTAITVQRLTTAFYIISSDTSSGVEIHLNQGASITLLGVSTGFYQVKANTVGSTVGVTS